MIYDGHDFKDLLVVEDIQRPLISPIDASIDNYSGLDNSTFFGASFKSKTITVTVRIDRPFRELSINAGFEKARKKLAGLLFRREPCKLILHDAPDLYEMAILSGTTDLQKLVYIQKADLDFKCINAASYGQYHIKDSSGGQLFCDVGGTATTYPIITIESTRKVNLAIDGNAFEFLEQRMKGTVVVDCERHIATCNGAGIVYSIYSDFPSWDPGIHEIYCDCPFKVEWRERWL